MRLLTPCLIACALLGCQSPPATPATTSAAASAPAPPEAPDLTGSHWQLRFEAGSYRGDYAISLLPGGKLDSRNPQDNTPDNDRWEQHGSRVLLLFNDGFARFEGEWLPTQRLAGTASSPSAGGWLWQAERLADAPAP